jgi:RNA-directed DNA polymerase
MWCRLNRHLPIREQYQVLCQKLRGHYAYYGGLIGNIRSQQCFRHEVVRLWRKWLARRKRRGQFPWARLNQLLRVLVLPQPRGWVLPCAVNP